MRKLLTGILIFLCFLFASAYDVTRNVESGLLEMRNGNIEEAIKKLKRLSATNDVLAQFYIAQCYEYGIGMDVDLKAAFSMYRRTAERGFAPGMLNLARCYRDGIGVNVNSVRASELHSRYLERNYIGKIPDLLEIYREGLNNAEKYDVAVERSKSEKTVPPVPKQDRAFSLLAKHQEQDYYSQDYYSDVALQGQIKPESDVDIDIPLTHSSADNVFALIIANENYQDVANVPHALNDGEIIAKYCKSTFGLPSSNIHLVKDATLNNIKREINLLRQIAEAYKGDISLIVYYAGHGVPDEKTNKAYLMPVDGFSADLTTCLSMSDFYESFGSIPTSKTIILMDACFSGSVRGDDMLYAARGVKIKPKQDRPMCNTVVISSAQGDETAYPYDEQNHGLFTYYLLKKLKESNGVISIGTLFDSVKDLVVKKSLIVNGKAQTPSVNAAEDASDLWYNWKFN